MFTDLIVVGGGAAGFFGAIQAAELKPDLKILIVEKSPKLLSKVRISGGGRCNVTHHCFDPVMLSSHYPRGEKSLRQVFKKFNAKDTVAWFHEKGVELKAEADGRMFPVTDDSQTIIDCFMREVQKHKIRIELGNGVTKIVVHESGFEVVTQSNKTFFASKVLITTGGSPTIQGYQFIADLGHTLEKPIPSLFTFNDSDKRFTDLMGVSVPHAEVRIIGTKFSETGPVLITHWGLSGPAVIKLSAWAAQYLHQTNYVFNVLVNWTGSIKEDDLRKILLETKTTKAKQKIWNNSMFNLPQRLWGRLCYLAEIEEQKVWGELALKNLNKLLECLIRCPFHIKGKTTFKEEFVTCGGVDLREIDLKAMESKKIKGLFFAGEVLNIDGETGGFNFQAAWSTASVAARAITAQIT